MTLTINGERRDFDTGEIALDDLLDQLGFGGRPVVVELDKEAVHPAAYPETPVRDGASLEVVTIAAGG